VSPLYFNSGFPFAYLAFATFLVACVIAAGAMLWRGRRPGRRNWAIAGILILGLVASVVYVNLDAEANLTWNPRLVGTASLLGRWSGDGSALTLSAEGRYRCDGQGQCQVLSGDGRWTRDRQSPNITLWPAAESPRRYNILSYRGHLRLIDFVVDPDEWDGRFVFSQIDSAAR
jgi:hypothetical protein